MGRRTTRLWTLIHMVIVFGTLLMLASLVAIRHTAEGGLPEALAQPGVYAGMIGVTTGIICVTFDGFAAKTLADQWAQLIQRKGLPAVSPTISIRKQDGRCT